MKNNYWESKPDAELDTTKNILRYWKSDAKLQVCMPHWLDKDGVEKNGKCVTISLDALREADGGIALLEKIIEDIT